jgi:hypothetical protein
LGLAAACERSDAPACEAPAWAEIEGTLYAGTGEPGLFSLSPSQRSAIVLIEPDLGPRGYFCSATHLGGGWVLSAGHCALGGGLWLRQPGPDDGSVSADTLRVRDDLDALLAHFPSLEEEGRGAIPLLEEDVSTAWLGTRVMLAGYGEQRDGSTRQLQFLTEPIVELDDNQLVVNGDGRSGAYLGDSGGPMLALGADGRARVLGELSHGDGSCLGSDRYVRADRLRGFVADVVGKAPPHPSPAVAQPQGLASAKRTQRSTAGRASRWPSRAGARRAPGARVPAAIAA